jgi:hypothetical protein
MSAHLLRIRERMNSAIMREKREEGRQSVRRFWIEKERNVQAHIDNLRASNEFKPYYVLGFPARYTTTITIISTLVSFYVTLISAYNGA